MIRTLFRLALVIVVIGIAAAFFLGYRWGGNVAADPQPAIGTAGSERARETGARIGEKVAVGAERAREALDEASLTAKVKSKIALDDTLDGTDVRVRTSGTVVTVDGQVSTVAQRQRAVQLARETEGVTEVVDSIAVRAR